jgi:rhamnosyltransferase
MKIGLCVPVLNPGKEVCDFIDALGKQSLQVDKILVIDSDSDDEYVNEFKSLYAVIHKIARREFDHGGTRQLAVEMMPEADVIVYLTQDAILANEKAIENLVGCFQDETVGAVYGRQLPRPGAHPIEAHARFFNYPDKCERKCKKDIDKRGIKTIFISNSFAAYRVEALSSIGGFPRKIIFGEDTCVAGKMISKGWDIVYCASAQVYHSHYYSYREEFRRYFDVGVLHADESWILTKYGRPSGEGRQFVMSEVKFLLSNAGFLVPSCLYRTFIKYMAYKLGTYHRKIPTRIKLVLTRNASYWSN